METEKFRFCFTLTRHEHPAILKLSSISHRSGVVISLLQILLLEETSDTLSARITWALGSLGGQMLCEPVEVLFS
jgi:hypothetical protein